MKQRRLSVSQKIMSQADKRLNLIQNNVSRRNYRYILKRYITYCRQNHDCRNFQQCKEYIQEYLDNLANEKTASTIHTYCAALAYVWELKMSQFQKPRRVISEFKRNRKQLESPRASQLFTTPCYQRLIRFQSLVGLRRHELERLTSDCFVETTEGAFVYVKRGKGGKSQLQFVDNEFKDEVKGYFTSVKKGQRIFTKEEMNNHLPLHKLRADCARNCYFKLLKIVQENPEYIHKLEADIREAWKRNKDKNGKIKPFPEHQLKGYYHLRKGCRQLALEKGLPTVYSRTIALWVSIYKLSHFRINVFLENYMLAV